ncbi:ornithine cyclodeaminase family protein [Polaromonas sp. P1-6]|nr:ornithine cyclodeaminase family protein [Polaromonas sp. P1-6]
MEIINEAQTAKGLPFNLLISALQEMFAVGCCVPLRHSHVIGSDDSANGTLLLMPAWQGGKRLGVKTVSIYPGNQSRGLPSLHSVFILYDAATGVPLALLDGDVITSRRTAAASALAAKYLSRVDANSLLSVGAGRVASLLPEAFRTVRQIEEIKVWDIDAGMAAALVDRLCRKGLKAKVVHDLETAVAGADIVSCATLSTTPLIHGAWLKPGAHLDLIGGFTPEMRESDDECFRISKVFVDTEEAPMKAGDILAPIANGMFSKTSIAADLTALCRAAHPGRNTKEEITLFKAVGTALEDLAAASLAYDAHQRLASFPNTEP